MSDLDRPGSDENVSSFFMLKITKEISFGPILHFGCNDALGPQILSRMLDLSDIIGFDVGSVKR